MQFDITHGPPPWESSCRTRTGPVGADGAVDAQNAPTAPWKTLCVFHELPQGLSNQITHEKPRKAPKWRWETRIDPGFQLACVVPGKTGRPSRDPGRVRRCAVQLAPARRRASDPAAVRRHAPSDLGVADSRAESAAGQPAWRRRGEGTESCPRIAPRTSVPVRRRSPRAARGSSAGRSGGEQILVRSVALGGITGYQAQAKRKFRLHRNRR